MPEPPSRPDGPGAPNTGVEPVDLVEGSRLRFPHWLAEDGYRHWDGYTLYDTERREHCAFVAALDGKSRCLPMAPAATMQGQAFADAECTESLGVWDRSLGDVHRYFSVVDSSDACGVRYDLREAGAEFSESSVYTLVRGICRVSEPIAGMAYFREGPPVSLAEFVAAEDVVIPRSGRLDEIHVQAEDRTSFRKGLFDKELGVACRPDLATDGTTRCVPGSRYVIAPDGPYPDEGCAGTRVAVEQSCSAGTAERVFTVSNLGSQRWLAPSGGFDCRPPNQGFAPADPWSGTAVFLGSPGQCRQGRWVDRPYVEVGAELAPSAYALLEISDDGDTRLRSLRYADSHGAEYPIRSRWAHDSLVDAACAFDADADGAARCTPSGAKIDYTDAACTNPVALVERRSDSCGAEPTELALVDGRLRRLGQRPDPLPSRLWVRDSAGACVAIGSAVSQLSGYELFTVGAEFAVPVSVTKIDY